MRAGNRTTQNTLAAFLTVVSLAISAPAHATCSDSPYIGSVCITAASYCPQGYVEAQGQLLSINSNTALYSLLGTTYGGDGRSTFGVPDLRGRTPVGLGSGPGLNLVRPGEQRGNEQSILTSSQLPSHTHSLNAAAVNATVDIEAGASLANSLLIEDRDNKSVKSYVASNPNTNLNDNSIGHTGDGQSFSNVPPQLGMRYCLAVTGLYPPRN